MSVAEILAGKSVCICAGAGGVGKTTTAAAVALGMAVGGARVAVVTIDPARRLAQSLGMEALENEPRRVDAARLRRAGLEPKGELWAMMLDPKRTFDELIDAVAADPEQAEAIKANRVYRELSGAVSGSQEFTAVSKLYELTEEHDFDLIVLDTPPSRNAVDFLEAPRRLTSFLDGRTLRTILRPTGHGVRLLGQGAGALLGALAKVTGVDLWADLTGFFALLGGMTTDFSARAARVERMLQADSTAFMLVTSAEAEAIDEAIWFRNTLHSRSLPFSGVVVNRFHHDLSGDEAPDELERHLAELLDPDLRERVLANQADYNVLARRDASNLARLGREFAGEQILVVPQFDDNVHNVEGLLLVQRYLFASDAQRRSLIDELVA